MREPNRGGGGCSNKYAAASAGAEQKSKQASSHSRMRGKADGHGAVGRRPMCGDGEPNETHLPYQVHVGFRCLNQESLLSRPDIEVLVWILGVIPFPSSTLGPSGCPPSLRASVRLSVGGREDATDRQCFAGPSDLPSFPKTKCSA